MKTKTKLKKYNLAGIKKVGDIVTGNAPYNYTCILLENECDIDDHRHEDLHSDIFGIYSSPYSTFGNMLKYSGDDKKNPVFPSDNELKLFRLMALAMTHEIARRMNAGDNVLKIS